MSDSHQVEISLREQYLNRVGTLLSDARAWCLKHELQVESRPHTVEDQDDGKYEVTALHIFKDGTLLAKLVPIGKDIIGADGRVDIVGWLGSRYLLFVSEEILAPKCATIVTHHPDRASTARLVRGVKEDGWYWLESNVRRAVRVDEDLFIDLVTDVSDYDL
ncbi:hypothetical protein [Pandoraea sp. NPDC090278]|uniref:hypothetical protein n=1 Tax=Pandoraea sp. NPDC090278 TaxID=3364391 RepID=UPI00383AC677